MTSTTSILPKRTNEYKQSILNYYYLSYLYHEDNWDSVLKSKISAILVPVLFRFLSMQFQNRDYYIRYFSDVTLFPMHGM